MFLKYLTNKSKLNFTPNSFFIFFHISIVLRTFNSSRSFVVSLSISISKNVYFLKSHSFGFYSLKLKSYVFFTTDNSSVSDLENSNEEKIVLDKPVVLEDDLLPAPSNGLDVQHNTSSSLSSNVFNKNVFNNDSNTNDVSFFISGNSNNKQPIISAEVAKTSDFFLSPIDIQDNMKSRFDFKSQIYNKPKFIAKDFSFLKSRNNSAFLLHNNAFIFVVFGVFMDVYKLYVLSHVNVIKVLQPVSFSYIQFLDLVIRNASHSNISGAINPNVASNFILFSNLLPSIPYFVGSAVYGQSLGAYDLIPFIPVQYSSYKFKFTLQNNNVSTVRIEFLNNYGNTTNILSFSSENKCFFLFDVLSFGNTNLKFYFNDSDTMYNRKSFIKLFNELFRFENLAVDKNVIIKAYYAMETTPTRSSVIARDADGKYQTLSGGFSTENVTLSNINFVFNDVQILAIVIFLFHLPSFELLNQQQSEELIKYVCSVFATYILNQVINVLKVNYIFIDLEFQVSLNNLEHNNTESLHNIFKSYVDKGLIMPLTPLHFKYYFNSNIQSFHKYVLSSVLIIPSLNSSTYTVLPHIDKTSKANFYIYANNKNMLSTDYYTSSLSYNNFPSYAITWDEFLMEIATKNILSGQFHDAIPSITSGEWKGLNASSYEVKCAYINRFFVKFNLINDVESDGYIDNLLWSSNLHPNFIKKSCRLVEKLPPLFERFVYEESDQHYVLDLYPKIENGKTIYTQDPNNKLTMKNNLLNKLNTDVNNVMNIKSRQYTSSASTNLSVKDCSDIINKYIRIRSQNSRYTFNNNDIYNIDYAFHNINKPIYNKSSLFLSPVIQPTAMLQSKDSDDFMIYLWNLIFPDAKINNINEIKEMSEAILHDYDKQYPSGQNMSEEELIRYITAHSSSSFLGIQLKSKSKFALDSLNKTIIRHASYIYKDKPWLINNLMFIKHSLAKNKIMNKRYGDVCIYSKTSSTSIPNEKRNFRDYVFENTLQDVTDRFLSDKFPPYEISAAQRDSRRGKSRLICSFHADIRILDFYINNGSYDLCNYGGLLSEYTTEGLSGMLLWNEMAKMSKRDHGRTMICLDFKGYDTQISLSEYIAISDFLNYYRMHDDNFYNVFSAYKKWMLQPKMLLSQGLHNKEILIPYYKTLASGLHGTHSFENLIGISYAKELQNRNIPVYMFKANGDDQNIMTHSSKVDDLMYFTNEYFDVEYSKSLIGHDLSVWGKKWFTRALYPVIEIGTIRSIWEKEGGDTNTIEPSKFENNYCKIINLIIFLIRLKINKNIIIDIMIFLCNQVGIRHNQIPVKLSNFKQIKSGRVSSNTIPVGLESDRFYLKSRTMDLNTIGSRNIYDMLRNSYDNKIYYSNEIENVEYHKINTTFEIEANLDYSSNMETNIPWMLRGVELTRLNEYQSFVRSVLQGTNSYDGPVATTYSFDDMYSLAMAIHNRNYSVWLNIQARIK